MTAPFGFANLTDLRGTAGDKLDGTIRIFLGVLFVMTGVMKLVVPTLADAWSGQLLPSFPSTPSPAGVSRLWRWRLARCCSSVRMRGSQE